MLLILVTVSTLIITNCFTRSILTGKIYQTENVYEELINLLVTEKLTSRKTVLTTSTEKTYVDWDFGFVFVGIYIPEYNVSLHLDYEGIRIYIREEGAEDYSAYIYNYEEKTLYGEADESQLIESFLTHYFEWCNNSSRFRSGYALDTMGDYKFKCANPIWKRE